MKSYDQKMAEEAFKCVSLRKGKEKYQEYQSLAMTFPSLIHSCGLVQAVAFAEAKNKEYARDYANDLAAVLNMVETDVDLSDASRSADILQYMRLSRRALSAASWLKRYVQTFSDDKTDEDNKEAS
jgi:CRISPR-associated protein Cmr5